MLSHRKKKTIAQRFRGLLPVVIDVETSGLHPESDALLEIAAIPITMDEKGKLVKGNLHAHHIEPFIGARLDPKALEVTGIDLANPLRFAIPEQQALHAVFTAIRQYVTESGCQRAVLVGHNAWFDLAFIQAAAKRCLMVDKNPFHSFTTLDTATMSALAFGETVLAKSARCAGIAFDVNQAHSAIYDVERTAELFCFIVNQFS